MIQRFMAFLVVLYVYIPLLRCLFAIEGDTLKYPFIFSIKLL